MTEAASSGPAASGAAETRAFRADATDVAQIDDWIEAVGAAWSESERTLFAARLCVSELAANVIEHGLPAFDEASDKDRIVVTLRRLPEGLGIEVADWRRQFDPTSVAAPERSDAIESASVGGRGLLLVRKYSTRFAYSRDGGANRVTLLITRRA